MRNRLAPLLGSALLLAGGAVAAAWVLREPAMMEPIAVAGAAAPGPAAPATPPLASAMSPPPAANALPLPPELPRIADGPEYDRCLTLLRTDPAEAMHFAQAWDVTGGGDGARHCLALAMLGIGEPDRAAERLERLAQGSRAGNLARAAVFAQASQAWMMANDPNRAFGAITIALTLSPLDAELLVDRSVVLAALRRYTASLEDLDAAIALEPDRAEAWVLRAAALRHLNRVDQAVEAVERALGVSPENAEGLLERGILRQLRGDVRGARDDWRRVIQLAPESTAADLAAQNLELSEAGPARR